MIRVFTAFSGYDSQCLALNELKRALYITCDVTAAKRDNTQNYVLEEIIEDVRKKYPYRGIFLHDGKIYFIRKLTMRECFRLMGVSDTDIYKIQAAGISKSQQYKMAGNSICVPTLTAIFRQLFIGNFNKVVQTEIF